jgi:uncharacterized membrane protein
MADFLYDNFIYPIINNGWYNPANTIIYGLFLVIGVYIVFRLLRRLGIGIDRRFLYAILPFIFWGSTTRVLHDAAFAGRLATPALNSFYGSPLFPTPGSYLITFGLALLVLLLSLVVQHVTGGRTKTFIGLTIRKGGIPYWKSMAVVGVILCAINVWLIPVVSAIPLLMVLGFWAVWTGMFALIGRWKALTDRVHALKDLLSGQNLVILSAHFFDAAATFTALTFFGYWEQHVVPNLFIPIFGPISMFFLKAVVVLPVLWAIDHYGEKGNFNNFLKIVIFILGIAPGLRDVIRLMAFV